MGNIAIVTGGTRGIGYAITQALCEQGYSVAAIYNRNTESARQCAEATGAHIYQFDVADFQASGEHVAKIEDEIGPVDVLINNAGITRDGTLHKMAENDWLDVINTNLNACFNMCRHVVPNMRSRGYGRIVNISSINGRKGQFGQTNYAAAKAGILGLSKSLALENAGKGITVNAICPGYVDTDMTSAMRDDVREAITAQIPVGRLGTPEEIAEAVTFLASEKASFVTGATLDANGGHYMA